LRGTSGAGEKAEMLREDDQETIPDADAKILEMIVKNSSTILITGE